MSDPSQSSQELRFYDRGSRSVLSFAAVSGGIIGMIFLLAMLSRHLGTDEYGMIIFSLILLWMSWRTWIYARSPYITLKSDHLVIQKFHRRVRVPYIEVTAIAQEYKTVKPRDYFSGSNRNAIPVPIFTLILRRRNGRLIDRVLPFKSDPTMIPTLEKRTGCQCTSLLGPEELKQWKRQQRLS